MTDKEILKLAAKAAGIELLGWMEGSQTYGCRTNTLPQYVEGVGQHNYWNPLTDDGDALRLAVKLGISIDFDFSDCCGETSAAQTLQEYQYEKHGNDPFSATRRAIVRAAAAIGKGME
jgi:hypothetical protein